MTKAILIFLTIAMLSACNTTTKCEPEIREKRFEVPVAVPCITTVPVKPVYQFGVGDYPSDVAAAKIIARDFEAARDYATAWESATVGCVITPTVAAPSP